ncbi:hypothetical protein CVO96_16965 [Deinococcus koreensis]|uniref:Uncharacterized protein n=1 Tax=Deinococcus koreensis TaxID=2054903 RepID=A0A2K3USZ2_9DEIO|nr:hypothetical protein CVO96_16965 [Deinococcus koreensis]
MRVIARPPPEPLPRRLLPLLFALAALTWLAGARAQNAVYYANDLQAAPAAALVSPGFLTVIEFYQEIDQISSGRPDLLHVEAAGAKIYVSALGRTGSTDLVIEVGARTQLLHVEISPGNATRRYVVRLNKPAPRPPAAPRAQALPVRPPASAPAARPPAPRPPAVTLSAPVARPAASPVATRQTWSTAAQPSWLSLRVIEQDLDARPDEVTLFFAVEHSGTVPLLVLSEADVKVSQNGATLPVRVKQGANPATLRAGRTHQGTLILQLAPGLRRDQPVTLSWTLRDPSGQVSYLVQRRLERLPVR